MATRLSGRRLSSDESWMFCPVRDRHTLNPFSYKRRIPGNCCRRWVRSHLSNPPEGALEQREWIQQYFQRRYSSYHPRVDRSAFFLEKSLSLVSPGGIVSCIMSNRWLRGSDGSPLRGLLASRQMEEIVDFSQVPAGVPRYRALCLIRVRSAPPSWDFFAVLAGAGFPKDPEAYVAAHRFPVDHRIPDEGGWTFRDTRADESFRRISTHGTPLVEFVMGQVHDGIPIPVDDPFVIEDAQAREWLRRDPRCRALLHRLVTGNANRPLLCRNCPGRKISSSYPSGMDDRSHEGDKETVAVAEVPAPAHCPAPATLCGRIPESPGRA